MGDVGPVVVSNQLPPTVVIYSRLHHKFSERANHNTMLVAADGCNRKATVAAFSRRVAWYKVYHLAH